MKAAVNQDSFFMENVPKMIALPPQFRLTVTVSSGASHSNEIHYRILLTCIRRQSLRFISHCAHTYLKVKVISYRRDGWYGKGYLVSRKGFWEHSTTFREHSTTFGDKQPLSGNNRKRFGILATSKSLNHRVVFACWFLVGG